MLQCLKFETDQQAELQNIEKFNNRFFALMARGVEGAGEAAAHKTVELTELTANAPFPRSIGVDYPVPLYALYRSDKLY